MKKKESASRGDKRVDGPVVGERFEDAGHWVEVYGRARLPSRFGEFDIVVFRNSLDEKEHLALLAGDVRGAESVQVRLHSECLTGDVLGSLRCDCREQLEAALESIRTSQAGILLYMRQEGRGIGLGNKIRAYALQEKGLDTFEANVHLGFDEDMRDYRVAALMLRCLGVKSVQLVTNNPRKVLGLRANGVHVSGKLPLVVEKNVHNRRYLEAKAKKFEHPSHSER